VKVAKEEKIDQSDRTGNFQSFFLPGKTLCCVYRFVWFFQCFGLNFDSQHFVAVFLPALRHSRTSGNARFIEIHENHKVSYPKLITPFKFLSNRRQGRLKFQRHQSAAIEIRFASPKNLK
jgi:hypothetical protein